ncbi:MAG: hypothetical protein GC137_07635 [Alphaproteobacteria bacterium]|nr:hypothetical protein [Alphaproteobacteria bacterium]
MNVNRDIVEKTVGILSKGLTVILVWTMVIGILLSMMQGRLNRNDPNAELTEEQRALQDSLAGVEGARNPYIPENWPPAMNMIYPDLKLVDYTGQAFDLSSYAGRVIIMEYIDMNDPISQAQSGAGVVGALPGTYVEQDETNSETFEEVFRKTALADITLPNANLLHIKVIVYGSNGAQASVDDAEKWAKHFDLKKSDNFIVAVPEKDFRGKETLQILAGYQLLDKNLVLRADSAGVTPKHNLRLTLIPLAEKLITR